MTDETRRRCLKCRAEHAQTTEETAARAGALLEGLEASPRQLDLPSLLHHRALRIVYELEGWCSSCALRAVNAEGRFARLPESR